MQYRFRRYIINLNKVISFDKYCIVQAYHVDKRKNYLLKLIKIDNKLNADDLIQYFQDVGKTQNSVKIVQLIEEKQIIYIFTQFQKLSIRQIIDTQKAKNIQIATKLIQQLFKSFYFLKKKTKVRMTITNPENIFFNVCNQVVVFNTTSLEYHNYLFQMNNNKYKLNYRYYAPQMIKQKSDINKSIIWSLGIIALQIYLGRYLFNFENNYNNFTKQLLRWEQKNNKINLSQIKNIKMREILKGCLEYDVKSRFDIQKVYNLLVEKVDEFSEMFGDLEYKLSSICLDVISQQLNELRNKQLSVQIIKQIRQQCESKQRFLDLFKKIIQICYDFFERIKQGYSKARNSKDENKLIIFIKRYRQLQEQYYRNYNSEDLKQIKRIIDFHKFTGAKQNFTYQKYGILFIKKSYLRILKSYLKQNNKIHILIALLFNQYQPYSNQIHKLQHKYN